MKPLTYRTLVVMEEIRQLKARYFRCVDTKDWDGFAEVFSDDAVLDFSRALDIAPNIPHPKLHRTGRLLRGREVIKTSVAERMSSVQTVHHGHTAEIEIEADMARAMWAMEDIHRWTEGTDLWTMHGYGHYHDVYQRIDGRWLITGLVLTRILLDVVSVRIDPTEVAPR